MASLPLPPMVPPTPPSMASPPLPPMASPTPPPVASPILLVTRVYFPQVAFAMMWIGTLLLKVPISNTDSGDTNRWGRLIVGLSIQLCVYAQIEWVVFSSLRIYHGNWPVCPDDEGSEKQWYAMGLESTVLLQLACSCWVMLSGMVMVLVDGVVGFVLGTIVLSMLVLVVGAFVLVYFLEMGGKRRAIRG
ncbi:hypothetical protein B0T17DRAFT_106808 [Bombardia bombarda]|uniref:Uncharacterized protein n=1 Tax=Bombardia bombarda TaxID=252184 RepID=A0AA39XQN2_9PEZI|nr:hypothetical protein B0T17DRAFT_106808 [Bombardia bombarda]